MKFKNKTILITGASSGIGALLAKECARLGANLIIGSRSEIKLNDVKNDIMENGGKCVAVKTDITRPADCKQLVTIINGEEILFKVIATDKTNDVAVLKTDRRSRSYIKINEPVFFFVYNID